MSKKSIFLLVTLVIAIGFVIGYCAYDNSVKQKREQLRSSCVKEVDTYIDKVKSALSINDHVGTDSYNVTNGAVMDDDKQILQLDNMTTDGKIRVDDLKVTGAEFNLEYGGYKYYIIYDGEKTEALN